MTNYSPIIARLLADPGGETAMKHRSAVVTAVNNDGTLTVDLSGVAIIVNALEGSAATVGDTIHLAAWAGDLLALGSVRPTGIGGAGLSLITPTSVAGTNVTLVGGTVTLAAASTASLNGCFPTRFDDFLICADFSAHANVDTQARLRVGGTDNSTASSYGSQRSFATGATPTSSLATQAQWLPDTGGGGYGAGGTFRFNIRRPNAAVRTWARGEWEHGASASSMYAGSGGFYHSVATAYDGITFFVASGSMTGTIRVYGLAK